MKKVSLSIAISGALCAMAYAGPEEYSGKEMKQVAPAPPECPNWTGFYIGGFGGYKFGVIDPSVHLFGDWVDFPEDVHDIKSRADKDLDSSGAEAGGLIGFNYQWNKWVFGLEAA